jgi:hypothetical protein
MTLLGFRFHHLPVAWVGVQYTTEQRPISMFEWQAQEMTQRQHTCLAIRDRGTRNVARRAIVSSKAQPGLIGFSQLGTSEL